MTRPGLASCSTGQPRPHSSIVPGRKFSTSTSDLATRRTNSSTPRFCRRSMVTDFLLRASESQARVASCRLVGVPKCRIGSPAIGCSTFSTSAPNSPMIEAAYGPARKLPTSITRTPLSGGSLVAGPVPLGRGCDRRPAGGFVARRRPRRARRRRIRPLALAWPAFPSGRLAPAGTCLAGFRRSATAMSESSCPLADTISPGACA